MSEQRIARRGITLVEVAAATVALAALAIGLLKVVDQLRQQTQELTHRQAAVAEAQAVLDDFTSRGWDAVTSEAAAGFARNEAFQAALPEADLKVAVASADDGAEQPVDRGVRSKRITVELSWPTESGVPGRPVRISTWIFAPRET